MSSMTKLLQDISHYLLEELKRHPSLAPQDVAKLCYQAAFGAEHMLEDVSKAQAYFQDEYNATPIDEKPLVEYISPTICRVNLSAWKRLNLNPDWLWRLFLTSICPNNDNKVFEYYITQAERLCREEKFPFTFLQWQEYISQYKNLKNCPPVRHSDEYRKNERPAYRIVSGLSAALIPIIEKLAGCNKGVIAIEGRAAAGKTTLANHLAHILQEDKQGIIRMDDFFLPPELRTAERLAQSGGNIHHERFTEDVLPYIKSILGFKYGKFDCSIMEYNGTAAIPPQMWRIVEGAYSCHPALGDYMDLRVFLDVAPAEQLARIKKRNSPKIAEDYVTKWIPMEEVYFEANMIREEADVVL